MLDAQQREKAVNVGIGFDQLRIFRADLQSQPFFYLCTICKGLLSQCGPQSGLLRSFDLHVCQTVLKCLLRRNHLARECQVLADVAGTTAEKVTAAHIGKQADDGFRHGHACVLGHQTQTGTLADAHATAHHHAVHEGNKWFGVKVDQVVEPVFLSEKIIQ